MIDVDEEEEEEEEFEDEQQQQQQQQQDQQQPANQAGQAAKLNHVPKESKTLVQNLFKKSTQNKKYYCVVCYQNDILPTLNFSLIKSGNIPPKNTACKIYAGKGDNSTYPFTSCAKHFVASHNDLLKNSRLLSEWSDAASIAQGNTPHHQSCQQNYWLLLLEHI